MVESDIKKKPYGQAHVGQEWNSSDESFESSSKSLFDEDIDDIRTTTPAAQVAPSPTEAALPQVVHPQDAPLQAAPPPSVVTTTPDVISYQGPITRARARELNFVTMLKNDGPEE